MNPHRRTPRTIVPPAAALLLCVALAATAHADAAYFNKAEMVRRSVAVAVVDVTRVESAEVKGQHWTYGQRVTAKVQAVLKGELPKDGTINIHGDESFICARCHFEPGRYVVFLRQDGGLWVGSNWHLSVRPIVTHAEKGEVVDWYKNADGIELTATPLADVLADVRRTVEATK